MEGQGATSAPTASRDRKRQTANLVEKPFSGQLAPTTTERSEAMAGEVGDHFGVGP